MEKKPENVEQTGEAKLFEALAKEAYRQVDKQLSGGTSTECRDNRGRTPLVVAAGTGNPALVGVVFGHNPDVDAADNDGNTAAITAALHERFDVVRLLVEHGADLGKPNREGTSALDILKDKAPDVIASYRASQVTSPPFPAGTETEANLDDDGTTTDGPTGASLSFASVDDGSPTAGPAGTTAGAAMIASPQSQSYVPELDLEQIPELGRTAYFEPYKETDAVGEDRPQGAEETPVEDKSDTVPATSPGMEKAFATVTRAVEDTIGKTRVTRAAISEDILAANEEKIVFDAWDNKMVRSVNEKTKRVLDKAGLELGDHTVATIFKSSTMPVLKPRSQEYKRFRKLWKHPDLLIDPRRWREWTGAAAVRRYCLAEGIDVSRLTGSHLIELYLVKDLKMILTLAEDAATHDYSVRQLKRAIEQLREDGDDHDPGKVIIKTLGQPAPLLEDPDLMDLCKDKDRVLEELSKRDRKRIRALLKARKPALDESKKLMDTLENILFDLEDE